MPLRDVEEEVVRYRRDAEELFAANQERRRRCGRAVKQLEEEWPRGGGAHSCPGNLQALLTEHAAKPRECRACGERGGEGGAEGR